MFQHISARALQRRRQASRPPSWPPAATLHATAPTQEPSHLLIESEPEVVEVQGSDRLADGRTRDDQLRGMEQAEMAAGLHVYGIIGVTTTEVQAQLEEFRGKIPAHRLDEEEVPGGWAIELIRDRLFEVLKRDIPFLGMVTQAWGVLKHFVSSDPMLNVNAAGQQLLAAAAKMWSEAAGHHMEIVKQHKTGVHEAYAAAAPGKGKEAVEAFLRAQGVVKPDVSTLSLSLENRLDDAIRIHRCRNDTLYQMAHGASCAVEEKRK